MSKIIQDLDKISKMSSARNLSKFILSERSLKLFMAEPVPRLFNRSLVLHNMTINFSVSLVLTRNSKIHKNWFKTYHSLIFE